MPAALFAALGMWGCIAGNGPLAAAGFAMAAQTRMELIVLVPLGWLAGKIPIKWKGIAGGLLIAEVMHLAWPMSGTPPLAEAGKRPGWMLNGFLPRELVSNLKC